MSFTTAPYFVMDRRMAVALTLNPHPRLFNIVVQHLRLTQLWRYVGSRQEPCYRSLTMATDSAVLRGTQSLIEALGGRKSTT